MLRIPVGLMLQFYVQRLPTTKTNSEFISLDISQGRTELKVSDIQSKSRRKEEQMSIKVYFITQVKKKINFPIEVITRSPSNRKCGDNWLYTQQVTIFGNKQQQRRWKRKETLFLSYCDCWWICYPNHSIQKYMNAQWWMFGNTLLHFLDLELIITCTCWFMLYSYTCAADEWYNTCLLYTSRCV